MPALEMKRKMNNKKGLVVAVGGAPQEHLPLPLALREVHRDDGMMMGWGLPYLLWMLRENKNVTGKVL
jgi:hypothetical protein